MARQSTTPVQFNRTMRNDECVLMTSGRAGKCYPVGFIPLLPEDSCSGKVGFDVKLREMPLPLLNAVSANFQAWFVPKSAFPQFPGRDELIASYTKTKIQALGQPDRDAAPFFHVINSNSNQLTFRESEFAKVLGLHIPNEFAFNTDIIDAFTTVYNFRLRAHSNKLPLRKYAREDLVASTRIPRAFWPSSRFANVVPDYDRALVLGSLDLDVMKGRLPVTGLGMAAVNAARDYAVKQTRQHRATMKGWKPWEGNDHTGEGQLIVKARDGTTTGEPDIWAEMAGQRMNVSLADIDKARTTQAFAKLRQAYAGLDHTGFNNDDAIVALLMQGISMPTADDFKRPWLLDSKRVPVGFAERFSTTASALEASVTTGMASATLSINVPRQEVSGIIVFTVEVIPERIDERMSDNFVLTTDVEQLPNPLRDIQRTEPVDRVLSHRVDAAHAQPRKIYGFEPMNNVWNRNFTRLGGAFFAPTPGSGFKETRANIWQTEIRNPKMTTHHWLCPINFPHDVFSDQRADAFELVVRHKVTIAGNTQIGDVLAEDNGEYNATAQA